MRYSLRTLVGLLAVCPVAAWGCVWSFRTLQEIPPASDTEREHAIMVAVVSLAVLLGVVVTAFDFRPTPIAKDAPVFRFTIRDMLWLTVVVGLWLAWSIEREALIERCEWAESRHVKMETILERFRHPPEREAAKPPIEREARTTLSKSKS